MHYAEVDDLTTQALTGTGGNETVNAPQDDVQDIPDAPVEEPQPTDQETVEGSKAPQTAPDDGDDKGADAAAKPQVYSAEEAEQLIAARTKDLADRLEAIEREKADDAAKAAERQWQADLSSESEKAIAYLVQQGEDPQAARRQVAERARILDEQWKLKQERSQVSREKESVLQGSLRLTRNEIAAKHGIDPKELEDFSTPAQMEKYAAAVATKSARTVTKPPLKTSNDRIPDANPKNHEQLLRDSASGKVAFNAREVAKALEAAGAPIF